MLTAQGYNQSEIAGRLGLSQSYVSRILTAARLQIAKWYDGTDETEEQKVS